MPVKANKNEEPQCDILYCLAQTPFCYGSDAITTTETNFKPFHHFAKNCLFSCSCRRPVHFYTKKQTHRKSTSIDTLAGQHKNQSVNTNNHLIFPFDIRIQLINTPQPWFDCPWIGNSHRMINTIASHWLSNMPSDSRQYCLNPIWLYSGVHFVKWRGGPEFHVNFI